LPRFLQGSKNLGGQNLSTILLQISPRFSPGSKNPGDKNLAVILSQNSPRFSLRSKFPAAKILVRSYCETRQDSCGESNSWQPKYQPDLAGNLAKIRGRK